MTQMEIETVEDKKEIAVQGSMELTPEPQSEMNSLLQMAISKDIDTDKLEKLIELKNKEEERACKKEFDFHFSEMQKEFEPIKRKKSAYNSKYAPLEHLQRKYGDIISKHGFSYRWTEKKNEDGKEVTIIISGWGHSEPTSFDVPTLAGNSSMNAIQILGSMSSYGKRYTFKSGFGIVEADEDDDGGSLSFTDGMKYGEYQTLFDTCGTLEELKEVYREEWEKLGNDDEGKRAIAIMKNNRKKELS